MTYLLRCKRLFILTVACIYFSLTICKAQDQEPAMWGKTAVKQENPDAKWFKDAKFGLFIHWGLYSKLAGEWNGKNYYGSGEWIMNQAKIPAKEYAGAAATFNPVQFNAEEWAKLAKDAGIKYMVITAKHHEGFAMYDSKASDFNIVKASPYKKDPMKDLAEAVRKQNIQFGFYYSQFADWHEPNGGGNSWDFDVSKKDYQKYYREKSVPQLIELLTQYGPLGIVWFDTPGGLTKEQTRNLVDSLHTLQPKSLFSSRVGQGMGDYTDFGDSEMPATPIMGLWESIYTHNDSWGYIKHDMNFKSSTEIIRLLATAASKGGNFMLNIGPDGEGNIPAYSVKFLRETGKWLKIYGESIYGTTFGAIPEQPWGVTTSKPGKLFLHVFNKPFDGKLLVPGLNDVQISKVYDLESKLVAKWVKDPGNGILVNIPVTTQDADRVYVIEYTGKPLIYNWEAPVTVSNQFTANYIEAASAKLEGNAKLSKLTFSHYYGDWKHATCITGMKSPQDKAAFKIQIKEPGDYKLRLEYTCPTESNKIEGVIEINKQQYLFRTMRTTEIDKKGPVLFIKHDVAVINISKSGVYDISINPLYEGNEIFKLKTVVMEPVK